jgi:hypothetical protein
LVWERVRFSLSWLSTLITINSVQLPPGFKMSIAWRYRWPIPGRVSPLRPSLSASAGRPAAYLKDGGADLRKAIRLLDEQGLASPCIDDISHVIANLLKWWYQDQPILETFLSACGRVSGKLKQTVLACLAPPKVQTKARFMNVHRLIRWAD